MTSLTLRNIPDEVIEVARVLSKKEKRSLNNEMVLLLEEGVSRHLEERNGAELKPISLNVEVQTELWGKLAGAWEDKRSTDAIIQDIYQSRTKGREYSL